MPNEQLLAGAISAFAHWRNSRSHDKAHTPEHLKQKVVSLLNHYTRSQIKTILGISSTNLSRWSQEFGESLSEKEEFVTLPAVVSPTNEELNTLKLNIYFTNGHQIHLSGQFSEQQLILLINEVCV